MEQKKRNTQFAIIGIGRFGLSIAQTLSEYDCSILACDKDAARLHLAAPYATHMVQLEAEDETALSNLGLGNFDVVIVAMGEEFEASLMVTMLAKEHGAPFVVAKARGQRQKKILENVGADMVVLPEFEMGAKIARKLADNSVMDILEDSEDYLIAEMRPREEWVGKSIREADIRKKHNLMILAIRHNGKIVLPVQPDRVLHKDDMLITLSERAK